MQSNLSLQPAPAAAPKAKGLIEAALEGQGFFAKQIVDRYRAEFFPHVNLLNNELEQLGLQQQNLHDKVTPEARGKELEGVVDFEVKRGLARLYSFDLLLKGDEDAYQQFIQAQGEKKLSRTDFQKLSAELKSLDENIKIVLRVSCVLVKSKAADRIISEAGISPIVDTEQFLTQVANDPKILDLLPITKNLTATQRDILKKMYLADTHFRHMMYTEGSNSMTKNIKQLFPHGFDAWRWRWVLNLMGFKGGPGAKYFDQDIYQLVDAVVKSLQTDPQNYLDCYLMARAQKVGFDQLGFDRREVELLAHLAAYANEINILSIETGKPIVDGYHQYLALARNRELVDLYYSHRVDPNTVSPTYAPAVLNSAYKILQDLVQATLFTCQVLDALYRLPHSKLISCRELAFERNLKAILEEWRIKKDKAIQFTLTDAGELQYEWPIPKTAPQA